MAKVLVFVETNEGQIKSGAMEMLNWARANNCETAALILGTDSDDVVNQSAHYGAKQALVCGADALTNYNPEAYTATVCQAIEKFQPNIVLASSSALARDLFPRIAARTDTSVASDCTELKLDGDNVVATRPLYAGKCYADVSFNNATPQIVLMRPNQLPTGDADSSATAEKVSLDYSAGDLMTTIKEVVKGASEKLDLTEANIVVSGGRGLKEAENFKLLEELADVLGATVGASRAVVDAGWVPHSMQVGQTGKTVAPTLYFAIGVSGAIQHLAGMSSSKVIVAINQDAEAPIFQKASYGIVGDLFEVVPKLTEEFRTLLN